MSLLKQDFVERRSHPCQVINPAWRIDIQGQFYELDLKMCQLKSLEYDFKWGAEGAMLPRMASIIETPSKILRLDLSLNELSALDHAGMKPFRNLRELNASLNKINNFIGIELLRYLFSLNLSHNFIRKIESLVPSTSLIELNLSMNELTDISHMPSLINLEVLNVSNNKLRSLDGVQSLVKLRELYAQRNNIDDVVPLTSCFHLQVLNVADNHITALQNSVDILAQLRRLEVLNTHGNPIEMDPLYREEILRSTNIMTLDNVSIRPLPKRSQDEEYAQLDPNHKHRQNIYTLKEAARQAFEERMRDAKATMADQIGFLQRRIVSLQTEYNEYENRLQNDLDSCLRYLDTLSTTEIGGVNTQAIRDTMGTPAQKPWHSHRSKHRDEDYNRSDYTGIKRTDEVLKFASQELRRQTPR